MTDVLLSVSFRPQTCCHPECDVSYALPAEPAPAWTSRPPTEPGWYFARWGGAPAGVVRVARGYDESDPTLHLWTMGEELCEPLSEVDVVEWWPVPIQPPEDETRSFSAPA